jgi:cytochrome b pre-mRNA-processing protein 3
MFGWFRKDKRGEKAAKSWYAAIMTKARDPKPYLEALVEDSLDGRFNMVTLVATLVMRRLRDFDEDGRALADGVYREVFSGFDHALREEGVGDSSIARKMRKMGEEFFGLARAIDGAFEQDSPHQALTEALTRNVQPDEDKAQALAEWLIQQDALLQAMPRENALSGQAPWSDADLQG